MPRASRPAPQTEPEELKQRPLDLYDTGPVKVLTGREAPSIRVYNTARSTLHLSNGRKLAALSEGLVSEVDLDVPAVRKQVRELK